MGTRFATRKLDALISAESDRSLQMLPRYSAANIDMKTWTYQEHSQNEGKREAGVISCFVDFGTPQLQIARRFKGERERKSFRIRSVPHCQ